MAKESVTKFVSNFMEENEFFGKLFVLDSLIKQAERIVDHKKETIEAMEGSMICGKSFVATAEKFLKEQKEYENR